MKKLDTAIYIFVGLAIFAGFVSFIMKQLDDSTFNENISCPADAMVCSDGSYVGRSGKNCEFICPPEPAPPADVQQHLDDKAHLIQVETPMPLQVLQSPLQLRGQAVGNWYFEASAPVVLVDWDGKIIAESYVTANGEWMTTDFVPFSGELIFESPYKAGDADFMKKGSIIFQKDNPSGLSEYDDALEIPIKFSE